MSFPPEDQRPGTRRTRTRRRRGFALVVTMISLILMSVLLLAFFSRSLLNRQITYSSTNMAKADMLARSALVTISGEIQQELRDAIVSTNTADGYAPVKLGVNDPDADIGASTIVKVSADGVPVRPGGTNFGSSIAVDAASLDGKSKYNWFSTGPQLGTAALPTWTYVTRGNGVKIPQATDAKDRASADYVVGRFAYTVYDVSGIMNANVAGYPINTPVPIPTATIGTKTTIAYANLTALGLSTAQNDQFVTWRNASLANAQTNALEKSKIFDEWATGIPRTSGTPNLAALNASRTGHIDLPAGDNTFVSRRDLLRFFPAQGMPAQAASCLTHFSRARNVPSWGPSNVPGSSIAYGDEANDPSSPNRFLPGVTADAMTARVYHDDGTHETVTWAQGDPLVNQRFSLARLAWLGHDGPNDAAFAGSLSPSEQRTAIRDCFGLEWNSTRKRWEYDHGASHRILTLDEVRQENRPPDFFELLKAGILEGSLGGDPGEIARDILSNDNAHILSSDKAGPIGRYFERYSKDKDRHIMQIGVNVIDQADADNFPTAVYLRDPEFDTLALSDSEKEFNATFFGIENLPMLQRVGNICMMDEVPDPTAPLNAWIQPEVWNMNDESTAGTGLNDTRYPTPTALRLVTFGASLLYNDFEMVTGDLVEFGDDFYNPTVDGTICFKNPSPATVNPTPFFAAPVLLKGFEKAPAARKYEDGTSPSGTENRYPQESTKITGSLNNNQFLAIYVGSVEVDPDAIPPLGGHRVSFSPSARLSFVLQYFDGSSWRPYSMLNRLEQLIGSQRSSNGKTGDSGWIGANGHVDPRTERFSGSVGRIGAGNNVRWQGGTTVRPVESTALATQGNGRSPVMQAWPRVTSGFTHYVTGGYYLFDTWIQNLPQNNTSFYADPDGVVRPGDGWRADIATGDGMIAYHKTTLPASATRRRPVILNRPFRSVGELGYVFRDQPFKSLDFWSEQSADAGLLDLFCVSEQMAPLMTGPVNPNAAPPRVLQAILHGATKEAGKPAESIKPAEASAVGDAVAGEIRANGPLANLSETVTRLSGPIHDAFAGAANTDDDKPINNKGYGEAPLRALSGNISDRIWNLLVDVSAQTGRIGSRAGGLEDFLVEGERRYWLHVAIDRTTGKIVDQQLEPYFE